MIEPTKLAWMAGIIDYKGRINRRQNKQRKSSPQVTMTVQCKERAILRGLGDLTGNTPETFLPTPVPDFHKTGCVEHCPTKHVHVTRDGLMMPGQWRWSISGSGLHTVLASLMPYLIVDRGYPELIEEIIAVTPLTGQGSAAVMSTCARLWNLGWPIPEPYNAVLMARLQSVLNTDVMALPAGPGATVEDA